MPLSKKILVLCCLFAILAAGKSWACSVSVNQLHQKNLIAAAAANEFGISFANVTGISFGPYSQQFLGEDAESLCPLQLEARSRVTINYKKKLQTCSLSVTVTRLEQIFGEPDGPLESHSFALPASSCVLSPLIIRHP